MSAVEPRWVALALEVLLYAEQVRTAVATIHPTPSWSDDEIESPLRRQDRKRHRDLIRGLRQLGYGYLDGVWWHLGGARVDSRQIMQAWVHGGRSNSEILAVLAWVRSRPGIARELWLVTTA